MKHDAPLYMSKTHTTLPRYTKFDDMPNFPRFTTAQFYLHALKAYVNPLCVPCNAYIYSAEWFGSFCLFTYMWVDLRVNVDKFTNTLLISIKGILYVDYQ